MIFIPMKKERRVCVIVLALLPNLTCALEWEVFEDFKRQLRESCRITADFEKSIDDLEYTAFKFNGFEGNAHCLFGYYSEVFDTYAPNDAMSVIEIRRNLKSVQDEPTLMSDIIRCLQKCVHSETTQVNQSENIKFNMHTIRNKDLFNYEVIRKDLDDMKKLNNTIQAEINCCISNLVLSSIEFFMPSFIIDAIRTYYEYALCQGRYSDGKIGSTEVSDFTGVKIAILKAFIDGSFATEARDTIKMFFANVNGVIGQMVDALMSFQDKNGLVIYDRLALEAKIREYFRQNLDNMLNNYLSQLVNRLSVKIEMLPVQRIKELYGWVIPMIKRSTDAARTKVSNINGQNVSVVDQMSDEEKDLFKNSNTLFLEAISLIQCIGECKNLRYSCKLIRLNSAYRNKCIRIFCNDVITKDNLLLICHILNNIDLQIVSNTSQIIFINVRRENDLDEISKQIEKLHMDEKYEHDCLLPSNTIVNKCLLYTKKRGKRSLSKFTIDFNHTLDLAKSCIFRDNNLLLDKIRDFLKQNCNMVKIESFNKVYIERDTITYDEGGICLKQPNHPTLIKRTIVISIIVGREIYEIVFNLCGDENSFEVIEAICPPYPNFNNDIAISKDTCKIKKYTDASQKHFLSGLLGYLRRMQFMSKIVIHPDFINERKHQNKFYKEISLPISSTPGHKINDDVGESFRELRDKIGTYHLFCPDTINVYAVEMHLADFLMRNNDLQKWYNRMESFLKASNINHIDFENLLDEFIYEHDRMAAINDQDISHINTRDYNIQVYAVLRKNSNTLLYLVRRELEFDLNVLPLTFALNTYVDFLNNFDSYSKKSSIKDLNVTNEFNAIFIRYVFKTMVKLRFDMLGDLKEQFETNKEQFKKVLFTFINPYRLLPIQIAINPKSEFISNCNISLYNFALVKVLENEILGIIEMIKQHQMQIQSEASIKVTVISLKDPDGSDLQGMEELNSQLQNCQ